MGIIKFSPIYRDARVLRQIKYLAPLYQLTVIGYGPPHPAWQDHPNVTWISIPEANATFMPRLVRLVLLMLGRILPRCYDYWYWHKTPHTFALEQALSSKCDAFLINDWETLPLSAQLTDKTGLPIIFDAHEYAPLEFANVWFWRLLHAPMICYFLRKYLVMIDAAITVAPIIAERYRREWGFEPIVVMNTTDTVNLPPKQLDSNHIRLIHHGVTNQDRRLEIMIETIALCDRRYTLHFMLVENNPGYMRYLKNLADQLAPGRITFHDPVRPEEIVHHIADYDIGFYLLAPTNYNNSVALPNKFFDFIAAGLAVCIGPSPSMAEIVQAYHCGCVAPSFDPRDAAETLNQLTGDQIIKMQQAAQDAAKQLNAVVEMNKVVELTDSLLSEKVPNV